MYLENRFRSSDRLGRKTWAASSSTDAIITRRRSYCSFISDTVNCLSATGPDCYSRRELSLLVAP